MSSRTLKPHEVKVGDRRVCFKWWDETITWEEIKQMSDEIVASHGKTYVDELNQTWVIKEIENSREYWEQKVDGKMIKVFQYKFRYMDKLTEVPETLYC